MFRKYTPYNKREVFSSPFKHVPKPKESPMMDVSEESNKKQLARPLEIQVDKQTPKKHKFQKS